MEGVSSEAASIAGHLKLGKLIYLYDDNQVSIEGSTAVTFTEDVGARFRAYGWGVIGPIDGLDTEVVDRAIRESKADAEHPSLIICQTIIGYGSPNKAGQGVVHGEPLGRDEAALAKERLGWPYKEPFSVPEEALAHFRQAVSRGQKEESSWQSLWQSYQKAYPDEAKELALALSGELPAGWDEGLDKLFKSLDKPLATRDASGRVLNAIAPRIPCLMGGSADLSPSTKTIIKDAGDFSPESYGGRNLHFGVREHAMGAIANGLALHGGIIPYTATFLIFYDYMRPPVRLAALMKQRVIFIFTHDSVGLGEDGPTHQPIEQLADMRAMPNLSVIRPADAAETTEAWKLALERKNGPTALILTRQGLPVLDRSTLAPASRVKHGGYVLWQASPEPKVILIATGSEVHIALEAAKQLKGKRISARVVSLPSWDIFEAQPEEYRQTVLPPAIKARISIEAAATLGWCRYVGDRGVALGLDRFGASAPGKVIYEKLRLTPQRVMDEAERLIQKLSNGNRTVI